MKLSNAIKKAEKATGIKAVVNCGEFNFFVKNQVLSFRKNNGYEGEPEATLFHVRSINDISDSMTDYFAGSFYDNLTQALNSLKN